MSSLAALISGIVASKSTQLPKIAAKAPDGSKPESRVKRFARWVSNDHSTTERYFVPYAEVMLAHLAIQTLVLVIDGSVVGRGGVALMIHVVYKGRALPLAWLVRRGKKGHFPEDLVWSKNSCGFTRVVFQQPAQPFTTLQWANLAKTDSVGYP